MGKTITVDVGKCLACKSCELACAVAHSKSGVLEEAVSESPKPQSRVKVEAVDEYSVPMQCRHCEDAPCITVCPTAAINRDNPDAPVLINQEKCIGCKFCLAACPFGVISLSSDGKAVTKCDFCIARTKEGKKPACVEACPTKALKVVDEKELAADKRRFSAREFVAATQQKQSKRKEIP